MNGNVYHILHQELRNDMWENVFGALQGCPKQVRLKVDSLVWSEAYTPLTAAGVQNSVLWGIVVSK